MVEQSGLGGPGNFEVSTQEEPVLGTTAYVLRDRGEGSEALVVPGMGANLISLRVPVLGEPLEVMAVPDPSLSQGIIRRYGVPILFPFPNRVRDGRFTFRGKEYQLGLDSSGQAIHGYVWSLPWQVDEALPTPEGARLAVSVESTAHPEVTRQFPFPFRLSASFTLKGGAVRMEFRAENTGVEPMPMGLGLHPWFRLPLLPWGRREECVLRVPADYQWELGTTPIPTGDRVPVPFERDFRIPRPLGTLVLDDLYTGVQRSAGWSEMWLKDNTAGAQVVVRSDERFRELVIHAPSSRSVICLEPYSCATDAFNLQARDIDAGMVVLEPGASWRGEVCIEVRPM